MKETTELILACVYLGNGVGKVAESNGFKKGWFGLITYFPYFTRFLTSLPSALSGISDIPKELETMSLFDRRRLMQTIKDKFDIPQDEIENVLEDALSMCIEMLGLFNRLKVIKDGTNNSSPKPDLAES